MIITFCFPYISKTLNVFLSKIFFKKITSKGQTTYLFGPFQNIFFIWVGHSLCTVDMPLTIQCVPMRYW